MHHIYPDTSTVPKAIHCQLVTISKLEEEKKLISHVMCELLQCGLAGLPTPRSTERGGTDDEHKAQFDLPSLLSKPRKETPPRSNRPITRACPCQREGEHSTDMTHLSGSIPSGEPKAQQLTGTIQRISQHHCLLWYG